MCMMIYVGTILEWDCLEVHDLKSKNSRSEIVRISCTCSFWMSDSRPHMTDQVKMYIFFFGINLDRSVLNMAMIFGINVVV